MVIERTPGCGSDRVLIHGRFPKLKGVAKAALGLMGLQARQATLFHRALVVLCAGGHRPFFVQVGANNGVDFDDTYAITLKHRMPGIVIEPISDYFRILSAVYARRPEVLPVNVALHPTAREMVLFRVAHDRARHEWEHGLASFSRDHLLDHGVPSEDIVAEKVPCKGFVQILSEYAPTAKVEVLIVDTEGFDAAIVRMADEAGLRPKVIRFEAAHLAEADRGDVRSRLKARGYVVVTDGHDYIAVQPPLHSPLLYVRALLNA